MIIVAPFDTLVLSFTHRALGDVASAAYRRSALAAQLVGWSLAIGPAFGSVAFVRLHFVEPNLKSHLYCFDLHTNCDKGQTSGTWIFIIITRCLLFVSLRYEKIVDRRKANERRWSKRIWEMCSSIKSSGQINCVFAPVSCRYQLPPYRMANLFISFSPVFRQPLFRLCFTSIQHSSIDFNRWLVSIKCLRSYIS